MSEPLPVVQPVVQPDVPRPSRPLSWRERLADWAEALDMTTGRLLGGVAVLAVVGFVGWRLLAPPDEPPEMRLPFVSTSVPSPAGAAVPASSSAPAAPTEVVVHVAGAVVLPGVQRLATGTRVIDAVDSAGGAASDADLARVNLAARLEDGQRIYVPRLGEELVPIPAAGSPPDSGLPDHESSSAPVDLNTASVGQLDDLPGIGPAIAQAIVDHRAAHGRFTTVEQLLDVRGIGQAKFDELRELVVV